MLQRAKNGDDDAKNQFFAHNMRLIWHTTHRFKYTTVPEDELFSLCQYAFLKAYNSFDLHKKVPFASYATRCMENEVFMFCRNTKKFQNDTSMEVSLYTDKDGTELLLADLLSHELNPEIQERLAE